VLYLVQSCKLMMFLIIAKSWPCSNVDIGCLLTSTDPVLSKHNILFSGKKDGYCCPQWSAAQLPEVCLPSFVCLTREILGSYLTFSSCIRSCNCEIQPLTWATQPCWLRGPVVENWSLASVLLLSCARPAADG